MTTDRAMLRPHLYERQGEHSGEPQRPSQQIFVVSQSTLTTVHPQGRQHRLYPYAGDAHVASKRSETQVKFHRTGFFLIPVYASATHRSHGLSIPDWCAARLICRITARPPRCANTTSTRRWLLEADSVYAVTCTPLGATVDKASAEIYVLVGLPALDDSPACLGGSQCPPPECGNLTWNSNTWRRYPYSRFLLQT